MNSGINDDDETSFEGLVAFDTVPPPGNHRADDEDGDVHSACTAVAQLPDSFLEELKSGVKADVSRFARRSLTASPPITREEPEEDTQVLPSDIVALRRGQEFEPAEPPTSPYGSKILGPESLGAPAARAMGSVRPSAVPPTPSSIPEPYAPSPSYAPSRLPDAGAFDEVVRAAADAPAQVAPSMPPPVTITGPSTVSPSFTDRMWAFRQSLDVRVVLVAAAVAIALAVFFAVRALLVMPILSD